MEVSSNFCILWEYSNLSSATIFWIISSWEKELLAVSTFPLSSKLPSRWDSLSLFFPSSLRLLGPSSLSSPDSISSSLSSIGKIINVGKTLLPNMLGSSSQLFAFPCEETVPSFLFSFWESNAAAGSSPWYF